MSDNFPLTPGSGRKAATDEVTYSGEAADVQLIRNVLVQGAEGSRVVVEPVIAVKVTPTISTTAYSANDQVGGVMTFAGAARDNGMAGQVLNCVVTSRTNTVFIGELWLFRNNPTLTSSDNAAIDLTDANLEAAGFLGIIDLTIWANSASNQAGMGSYRGSGLGGNPLVYVCDAGGSSIYGVMVTRTTPTFGSTTDLQVELTLQRL